MLLYCLKCRKNTESTNPKVKKKKKRIMILEKCEVCDSRNQNLSKSKKLADY